MITVERELITEPGIYDLTDAEYHSDPVAGGSLSSTGARRLLPPSCPAKFRHYQQHPEVKAEYDFGHAAHHAVLGIGPEIIVLDYDNWKKPSAREQRDAIRDAGKVPLLKKEADVVAAMAAALRVHPVAGRLFRPGRGVAEQTLVWRDRTTGIMRRALLDWRQDHVVADYKTCDKAEPSACARSIHTYGYHCQADWYLDGVGELGLTPAGKRAKFAFVFQEKTAPYLVTVVEPDQEALLWGSVLNTKAIDIYRDCTARDVWPGYHDTDLVVASLPPYAVAGYERARERGDYDVTRVAA